MTDRHPFQTAGTHTIEIAHGGRQRSALVYVPTQVATPAPLLMAFHGAGSSADEMVDFTGLNELAERASIIVVYPDGTGRSQDAHSWNAGAPHLYASRHNVDDVGFVRELVSACRSSRAVDMQRIYATGMSNGGLLCYHLADHLPGHFAAIAPVACAQLKKRVPEHPIPLLHIHGTADAFVPFAGGQGGQQLSQLDFVPVVETVRAWAAALGCDATPETTTLPTRPDDATQVTRCLYRGGRDGGEVGLVTIAEGGHTWPGRSSPYPFLGVSTRSLDGGQAIWDFVQRFSLPAPGA